MQPAPFSCPPFTGMLANQAGQPYEQPDPVGAAIGIFWHLKDQLSWPEEDIKELGQRLVEYCEESTSTTRGKKKPQTSAREVLTEYFANFFKTDSASLTKSGNLEKSFSETFKTWENKMYLVRELSESQIKEISRAILGDPKTTAIFYDYKNDISEIGYQVITSICQTKGSRFTIGELLDGLKHTGAASA